MGLLSRAARRVGRFVDGAAERMGDRAYFKNYTDDRFAPASSAVAGALGGGFIGSATTPDDPGRGALMGAGVGALGGAGLSLARQGAAGIMGGLRALGRPEEIAAQIRKAARQPGDVEAMVREIAQEDPDLAQDVMQVLMGQTR